MQRSFGWEERRLGYVVPNLVPMLQPSAEAIERHLHSIGRNPECLHVFSPWRR